jgi:hypothetical protein
MNFLLPPRAFAVIENSSTAHPPMEAEPKETWKHISVALAPVVARMRRLRALDEEASR